MTIYSQAFPENTIMPSHLPFPLLIISKHTFQRLHLCLLSVFPSNVIIFSFHSLKCWRTQNFSFCTTPHTTLFFNFRHCISYIFHNPILPFHHVCGKQLRLCVIYTNLCIFFCYFESCLRLKAQFPRGCFLHFSWWIGTHQADYRAVFFHLFRQTLYLLQKT